MNGTIGLNILGDRTFDRAVLISAVQQLAPAYCVVMNNPSLAAELTPYTTVIVRRTPDDDAQNHVSGADFVAARAADVPKGGYLYLTNEPGKSAAAKLDTWTWEALAEAESRGIKCCILNWATGNPEPDDWNKVALCVKRAVNNGHLIGVHEYFNRAVMNDYPWHVGRFIDAQRRFGGRWVVTELGEATDFDPHKGWQTAYGVKEYRFELDGAAGMYASHGVGTCLFSYPDWDGHGFGVDNPDLLKQLAQVNLKYPLEVYNPVPEIPTPTPDPIPTPPASGEGIRAACNAPNGVNLRRTPSASGEIIRALKYAEEVTVWTQPAVPSGKYTFIPVLTQQGEQGYAAQMVDINGVWSDTFIPAKLPGGFTLKAPFRRYTITSRFNDYRDYSKIAPTKKQAHEGIDFVDDNAKSYKTDPIVHVGSPGIVSKVDYDPKGYGNYIEVNHGNGFVTVYGHLAEIYVRSGQKLDDWQIIGLMGWSGNVYPAGAAGAHLHLTVSNSSIGLSGYVYPSVIDPELYLVAA